MSTLYALRGGCVLTRADQIFKDIIPNELNSGMRSAAQHSVLWRAVLRLSTHLYPHPTTHIKA